MPVDWTVIIPMLTFSFFLCLNDVSFVAEQEKTEPMMDG